MAHKDKHKECKTREYSDNRITRSMCVLLMVDGYLFPFTKDTNNLYGKTVKVNSQALANEKTNIFFKFILDVKIFDYIVQPCITLYLF